MISFSSKSILSAIALAFALGSATSAFSATDTAQSTITLTFSDFIEIDNVNSVTIADPAAGSPATGSDTFCVAGSGFNFFSITFSTDDPAIPEFLLLSSNGSLPIAYQVFFANNPTGTAIQVFPNDPLPGQSIEASNCSNDTARFDIEIPSAEWENREFDGPFTGVLMITVESE
ncbi:hypothetical protein ACCI51_17570 [Microbulbifer echini]|uniref:CS1 type fimbrial major subunit n=1 Tax=Microbulbifer echini TaxID=1529067 RepID=A0ABV4NSE1_9GAMM